MIRTFCRIAGIASLSLTLSSSNNVQAQQSVNKSDRRPNIVLIMADDLGFSDVGCYGGEIHTPNIDFLANDGIRFTNFYNTSRCCPSRASLLTGVYNHNAGIGEMTEDKHLPGYRGHITDSVVTIAEVLKQAGYHTAMSGKWHVSNTVVEKTPEMQLKWLAHQVDNPLFSPKEQYPVNRGFEKYFGNIWGVVDYFDPFSLVSGTTPIKDVPKDYYHTDAINDTAVAYIKELSKEDRPFFLYVAQTAPHWPLMAPEAEIEKYKDTYKAGWDNIREVRYKKMAALGLIDPNKLKLPARQNNNLWKDNADSAWDARAMAVHAAMVDRMDQGIGRIIQALKEANQLDNTIIIFLSDNGASAENAANYGPGFDRPGQTRSGETIHYLTKKEMMPGAENTYASIGPDWANVANTPYRLWKEQSYEGGIHTPFIIHWPKGIALKKGSMVTNVCHIMDVMPTFIDAGNAEYPSVYDGHKIKAMQGISFLPVLQGKKLTGHEALFNEHFGAKYVRYQNWKLVAKNNEQWHLYDIVNDPSEINDLASNHPGKVKELGDMWLTWAGKNNVVPKK